MFERVISSRHHAEWIIQETEAPLRNATPGEELHESAKRARQAAQEYLQEQSDNPNADGSTLRERSGG